MFYAEKNNGAFFNNQRIRVSKKNNISECLFALGKIKNNPELINRRSGSAALDMAYVAAGRYDGYFQKNLNLWDIAAGAAIVNTAGGSAKITNQKENYQVDVVFSNKELIS